MGAVDRSQLGIAGSFLGTMRFTGQAISTAFDRQMARPRPGGAGAGSGTRVGQTFLVRPVTPAAITTTEPTVATRRPIISRMLATSCSLR